MNNFNCALGLSTRGVGMLQYLPRDKLVNLVYEVDNVSRCKQFDKWLDLYDSIWRSFCSLRLGFNFHIESCQKL